MEQPTVADQRFDPGRLVRRAPYVGDCGLHGGDRGDRTRPWMAGFRHRRLGRLDQIALTN